MKVLKINLLVLFVFIGTFHFGKAIAQEKSITIRLSTTKLNFYGKNSKTSTPLVGGIFLGFEKEIIDKITLGFEAHLPFGIFASSFNQMGESSFRPQNNPNFTAIDINSAGNYSTIRFISTKYLQPTDYNLNFFIGSGVGISLFDMQEDSFEVIGISPNGTKNKLNFTDAKTPKLYVPISFHAGITLWKSIVIGYRHSIIPFVPKASVTLPDLTTEKYTQIGNSQGDIFINYSIKL